MQLQIRSPFTDFWTEPGGETGRRKGHVPGLLGGIEKGRLGPWDWLAVTLLSLTGFPVPFL